MAPGCPGTPAPQAAPSHRAQAGPEGSRILVLPTSDHPGALWPWKGQCQGGAVRGTNPRQLQAPLCCCSRGCPSCGAQPSLPGQPFRAGKRPGFAASLPSSLRWMGGLALRSILADSGTRVPALTDQPLHRCSAENRLCQGHPSPRNTRVQVLALPREQGVIDGVSAEIQDPRGSAQGRLGRRSRRGIFSHVIHSYLQPD